MSGIPPGSCLCSTGSRLSSWWHRQWGPARSGWAQAHPSTCKPPWWVQVGADNNRHVITGGEPQGETRSCSLLLKPPQQLEPIGGSGFLSDAFILDFLKIRKLLYCQVAFYNDGGIQIKTFRWLRPVLFTFWFLNTFTKVYLVEKKIGGRRKVDRK